MDFKSNSKITKYFRLSPRKSVLLFIPTLCLFLLPAVTHASFWSSVMDIFSGPDASAQAESVIETNSQNIPLPEPATNFDPAVKPGATVAIDGNEALLPEVGPSTKAPEAMDNSNGQISIYTVRSGDTLAEIADMFDVTPNTILWANDLTKGSTLKPGQTLVILPISGVMHTVVKGDTLKSIAKKYGGDLNEIADFNDLQVDDKLVVGDTVLVPDGELSSSISTPKSGTSRLIATDTGPSYVGYYARPYITGHKTQGLHGHNAVDIGMPIGSNLYAAAAGTVIVSKNSGWNGGYGNYVVIQHPNKTQTVYGHMTSTVVLVGQTVVQGQLIGYSGNTGKSTGPHLHFEVRGAKNPF